MTTALLSSALFGACPTAAATSSSVWQQLAKTDLDYVYQQIKANHPGVIDSENPSFSNWLEQGYQQTQQDIARVTNLNDLMNIHRKYFAGFANWCPRAWSRNHPQSTSQSPVSRHGSSLR